MKFTQEEVQYDGNGGALNPRSQACSTCRWFEARDENGGVDCHIVDCYPMPITSNAWCNQWAAMPVYEPEPLEVVIVEAPPEAPDEGTMEMSTDGRKTTIMGRGLVDKLLNLFKGSSTDSEPLGFKDLGDGYYFAPFTNNFKDREGEILSASSHKRYVARVNAGLVPMPELWIHHIPGTRHGKALYVGMTDHTVFAVGKYDQTPLGQYMQKVYQGLKPGTLAMSHGFKYPLWAFQNNVYNEYNSFEHSVLPPGRASNPYTPFMAVDSEKELTAMPLSQEQKAKIASTFPGKVGETVLGIIGNIEQSEGTLKEIGVEFKDFAEIPTDPQKDKAADSTDPASIEAIKAMIPDLYEGQLDLIQLVTTMGKALTAMKGQLDETRKALALTPTPASRSLQTEVKEGKEKTDAEADLKKKSGGDSGEVDPAFPGMGIPRRS